MNESAKIINNLDVIFGKKWWDKPSVAASKPGWVDLFMYRIENGIYSVAQHWGFNGVPLPGPQFVLRCHRPQESVRVICWEDWLDCGSSGLNRQFKSIQGKEGLERERVQEDLSQLLLDYLQAWNGYSGEG